MKRKCEVISALVCNTDFNGQLNMIIKTTQVVTTAPRHPPHSVKIPTHG